MPKRTTYRNGEEIILQLNGCDGCSPMRINGVLCHEPKCPDAWKDYSVECKECGVSFFRTNKTDTCCSTHCTAVFWGDHCGCDECDALAAEGEV